MQLTIINGSPRGSSGNTQKLLSRFISGFEETEGNSTETFFIIKERRDFSGLLSSFKESETVLLGFPLYVDAMPGIVKEFIESLSPLMDEKHGPDLIFMVQSGFPETHHTRFIQAYLQKLSSRINCRCIGCIMKGGCEGLEVQPAGMVEKIFSLFYRIGKEFGETGIIDEKLLAKLAFPENLTSENLKMVIPFVNSAMWDERMKKHDALEKSRDKPFGTDL